MDAFLELSWAWLAGWSPLRRAQRALGGWSLFFDAMLEAIFFALGGILGGLGRPKWRSKSIFERFFGSFFSHAISASILDVFWRLRTLKIELPPRREHDFHKIDVFKTLSKNDRFWSHFWMPKPWKFDKKSYQKTCLFSWWNFGRFFWFWLHFGRLWGPRPLPKFIKNRPRRSKNWFWDASWTRLLLKVGVGRVLGGFWIGFGKILEGFLGRFWEDVGRINSD